MRPGTNAPGSFTHTHSPARAGGRYPSTRMASEKPIACSAVSPTAAKRKMSSASLVPSPAKETGRVDYFKGELEGRQKPNQVKTVYKSLHDVHLLPDKIKGKDAGKSVMQRDGNEELSKSLI